MPEHLQPCTLTLINERVAQMTFLKISILGERIHKSLQSYSVVNVLEVFRHNLDPTKD